MASGTSERARRHLARQRPRRYRIRASEVEQLLGSSGTLDQKKSCGLSDQAAA